MLESLQELMLAHFLQEVSRRKELEQKRRAALESAFETMPGDRRFVIRRQEAVDCVVKALGIGVVNNGVHGDVQGTAKTLGWEAVKNGNRALFRCVRRRDIDPDTALAVSRENRRDPRNRRRPDTGTTPAIPK
ncbi:MAG: hypothetical protein ABSF35_14025 [Polyangia bacterium]|jgi:hypothetical protein